MARCENQSCCMKMCCCGCLLPLALLKTIFVLPFSLLLSILVAFFGSLFYFFRVSLLFIYYTIRRQDLGCNVKFCCIFFGIIPISFFIPGCIILGIVWGFFFGIGYPIAMTCSESKSVWWGFEEAPREFFDPFGGSIDGIENFIDAVKSGANNPLQPGMLPFEITLMDVIKSVVSFLLALSLVYPLWCIIIVIKAIPFLFRGFYQVMKLWRDHIKRLKGRMLGRHRYRCQYCCAGFGFSFLFLFTPLGWLAVMVFLLFYGFLFVLWAPFVSYDAGFKLAMVYLFQVLLRWIDKQMSFFFVIVAQFLVIFVVFHMIVVPLMKKLQFM